MEEYYLQAREAYSEGNQIECLKLTEKGASLGDDNCIAFLGTLYLEGECGLDKDILTGMKLLNEATDKFNLMATYVLGQLYYNGGSIKRNKKAGLRLIRRAAFMRFVEAQWVLNGIYAKNIFKWKRSAAWGIVAANNGHKQAIDWVNGLGGDIPQDTMRLAEGILNCVDALYIQCGIDWDEAIQKIYYYEQNEFKLK